MSRYEITKDEYRQYEKLEKEERDSYPELFINTDNELLKEIISGRLNKIHSILKDLSVEKASKGFNLVKNFEFTLTNMQNNKKLYLFLQKFSDNNLSLLGEDDLVEVLNTLYKVMNIAEEENSSWGAPTIIIAVGQ
ncbi:hypothetical protein M3E13_07825 [Oceanobacillus kimchii]|uniref:hypothetical protein n=1 Tax=Oceanobacillus kimchii TaxID=746691 RepID=UPI0021A66941|nr:hypothetical protein [Oceanobacillus kimchii]MCT1576182.1 hypothetical protein [Oceanobacillus kimchii]MCT2135819.1 hypothetical protein [Oceanobacillus kimchii]